MLELHVLGDAELVGPSGVPFIEMLEYDGNEYSLLGRPSGVPFIEMLELSNSMSVSPRALAECHSLRC